jgi:hypothetical protein
MIWEEVSDKMRASEFIFENTLETEGLEDAADFRGDENIINVLGTLKHQSKDTHTEPRIRLDSFVSMVRDLPGTEMFTAKSLKDAAKSNPQVKELIKDIKDDDQGVTYVYISTEDEESDELDPAMPTTDPEKTVGSMAKRALSNRS